MRAGLLTGLIATICFPAAAAAGSLELTRPEAVGMSSERLERLQQHFQGLVNEEKTGGIQIVISRHGKVVMHEHVGYADIENNLPIGEDTLFRIYSMTKPVMGVAMMMLYEDGHYSLGDPLSIHIPEFAGLRVYAGIDDQGQMLLEDLQRAPTVHDLLQHTAGFTYGRYSDTPVDALYREANVLDYDGSLQEMVDKLASLPLLYQPGSRPHYSIAVDVQGYLVEKWSGMDVESFLDARIFGPLGMDETMSWVPPAEADRLATVYTHDEEGRLVPSGAPMANRFLRRPGMFSGGSQLISTGDDFWQFAQMLLDGGTAGGERLLSRLTVEMMTSNRFPAAFAERVATSGRGYGYNLLVVTDPGIGHFPVSRGEYSHTGLATTNFFVDPSEGIVAVFLTQYLPFSNQPFDDALHRLLRAAIMD